jgi:hypothetical protein
MSIGRSTLQKLHHRSSPDHDFQFLVAYSRVSSLERQILERILLVTLRFLITVLNYSSVLRTPFRNIVPTASTAITLNFKTIGRQRMEGINSNRATK